MNELAGVPAFMFALINFPSWEIFIKSTIVIALAALGCRLLDRQSAALRHRVWVCGLAASLVVPMVCLSLPQFRLAVLPSTMDASRLVTTRGSRPPSPRIIAASSSPGSAGGTTTSGVSPRPALVTKSTTAISADAPGTVRKSEEFPWAFARNPGLQQVFVLCWLLGTMISSTLLLISLARQSIWLWRLRRIEDEDWVNSVTTAARTLGLKRPIVALESDAACIPTVVGALSPRLVVPSNWRTWSLSQRRCILLHELAHIKRRDVSTQLLGRLALLAYWFNPLVWHAVRQLRAERELASDDCVLLAGQTASEYAEELLRTLRCYCPIRTEIGVAMGHSARLDQRVLAILDQGRRRDPVGPRFAIILPCVMGIVCGVLGGVTLTAHSAIANRPTESLTAISAVNPNPVWKENYTVEYPGTLPVSVAYSADGKMLLTGDTGGEIMALVFVGDEALWHWKSDALGSHATVAFSADQKKVYATTEDGVRILDAASGKEEARIEAKNSYPTAIGVFPKQKIDENFSRSQIVFGNTRGYFVKSWVEGKLAETMGTIEVSTVAKGTNPVDEAAVPLAVDPSGRSAIMIGPVDATGEVGGRKKKNVLWAYVCGNYEKGSPGNRVLAGHSTTVVSAAWAKEGGTAVTGDANGCVIVWDAKTMKESCRTELSGRVAALAISNDGKCTAAYVLGKQGEVCVWQTAKPIDTIRRIHTEVGDFGGPTAFASLSFSPDGEQLAGCAIDKRWLSDRGKVIGKVRVWELSAAPKAQLPPRHVYIEQLPKGSSMNFIVLDNDSIVMPANEEGAVDFRRISDGKIQTRIVLGKLTIGGMKRSSDRKWFALEQRAPANNSVAGVPAGTFEVAVFESPLNESHAVIPTCRQLLDVAAGGKAVAVVREQRIELWGTATTKKLKVAQFPHTRIDAASFSPDGKLLALSDANTLILWQWEENTHARIDLEGALAR